MVEKVARRSRGVRPVAAGGSFGRGARGCALHATPRDACSRVPPFRGDKGRAAGVTQRLRAAADVAPPSDASEMPESWTSPPRGYKVYETMIIYNPDAQDADREDDIQDFQDTLSSLGALDIVVSYENVPQRMAYPIEGYNVGIYVLYMYSAPSSAAKILQSKLAAPSIEKEKTILRFMTTRA